ncbi:MAG: hypothetical protein ACRELD_02385 [Longimicrobiales bacterium]
MSSRSVLLCLVLAAACASGGADDEEGIVDFTATIRSNPGFQVNGNAQAIASLGRTVVTTAVTNATPAATHPWHVHRGSCGSGGPIVGDAADYPLLEIDADGQDRAVATIDVQLEDDEDYYINVHESPQRMSSIVACGALVD